MYVCDNCIKIEMDNDAAIQLLITSNQYVVLLGISLWI